MSAEFKNPEAWQAMWTETINISVFVHEGRKGSERLGYLHELTQQENSRLKFKPSSDKEVDVYNHHTDTNKLNTPPEL